MVTADTTVITPDHSLSPASSSGSPDLTHTIQNTRTSVQEVKTFLSEEEEEEEEGLDVTDRPCPGQQQTGKTLHRELSGEWVEVDKTFNTKELHDALINELITSGRPDLKHSTPVGNNQMKFGFDG